MGSGGGKEAAAVPRTATPVPQQQEAKPQGLSPIQLQQQEQQIQQQPQKQKQAAHVVDTDARAAKRDGRWFPVVLTSGSLHMYSADMAREAVLCVRLESNDVPFLPDDDSRGGKGVSAGGASTEVGTFAIAPKKQKLVSYFASGEQPELAAPSPPSPSATVLGPTTQWQRDSAILCAYEVRRWRHDCVNIVFCLTVNDSDGNRVVYEEAVNLLDGTTRSSSSSVDDVKDDIDTSSPATITVEFTSGFGFTSKKIASLEFSYQILFDTIGKNGGALLRLSTTPLQAQYPQIFMTIRQIIVSLNDAALTAPSAVPVTTDADVQELLEVADVLATSSKITFLKNKSRGKELSDKYCQLCKSLVNTLTKLSVTASIVVDKDALLRDVDMSASSIVNLSAQFFDNILTVRDSGKGKRDVTGFLERYRASADEFARKGVEAGESYSQLAALLCDVAGLIEPLVSAAPFGMLVVEAIGVLFKLIAGRKEMMELCEKIASRLTIFLRVLQQADVHALLREDEATLDACVSVYIAIDDCSECIKSFESGVVVVQLFTASARQAALQDCYDELHTQFEILHNVTSLRAMASAKKHQVSVEEKLEQLLTMQQTMLLTCNGNSALLSRLAKSEESMQDDLVSNIMGPLESVASTAVDLEGLVETSVRKVICRVGNAQVHEQIRRTALQHTSVTATSEAALGAIESSVKDAIDSVSSEGGKDMRPADVAAFVAASIQNIINGPALPTALKASSDDAVRSVKLACDAQLLTTLSDTMESAFKRQTEQHKKTRAEMRKQFSKLDSEMKRLQSDTVASIGDKIRDASSTMSVEIREVRGDIQALSIAVVEPLKRIEEHILQYTDYKALNKPLEIAPSELVRVAGAAHPFVLTPGQVRFSDARKALYRNRDVFVKTYTPVVDQSLRYEEAHSLFQLHHDRIVELVGTVVEGKNISEIVLEYLGGGAVRGILERQHEASSHRLTREQKLVFTYDIISGLNFLHSQSPPRVHTRLDLSNVVATSDLRGAKLVDFKSSTSYNPSMASGNAQQQHVDPNQLLTGAAPELFRPAGVAAGVTTATTTDVFDQQRPFSIASDAYAAGTTLYELWTGHIAFSGKRGNLLLKALHDGDEPFTAADIKGVPPVIQALLIGLTHSNPAKRISLGQILLMQQQFGLSLLEAPAADWKDYLPVWCSHEGEDPAAAAGGEHNMTLSTENIPKFTKVQLRKYLHEKEVEPAIIERIVSKGYTAKQYLRTDFVFKAFPPDIRSEFDEMHLDSLSELHDFDSDYHSRPRPGAGPSVEIRPPAGIASASRLQVQASPTTAEMPRPSGFSVTSMTSPSRMTNNSLVAAETHFVPTRRQSNSEAAISVARPSPPQPAQLPSTVLSDPVDLLTVEDSKITVEDSKFVAEESTVPSDSDVAAGSSSSPNTMTTTVAAGGLGAAKFVSRVQSILRRKKHLLTNPGTNFDALMELAKCHEMVKHGYAVHNGAILTKKECFRRALEADSGGKLKSQKSMGWWMLASCMDSASETATVFGNHVTRKQCIINTLECNDKHVDAWTLLTRIMGENETVVIPGKSGELSRKDCAVEALLCNTQDPEAWVTLGSILPKKDSISIIIPPSMQPAKVDRKRCLVKAVELAPTNARYWQLLSQTIGSQGDAISVTSQDGTPVTVTMQQALVKSVTFDPTAGNIWLTIALHLHDDGKDAVIINGASMGKKECLVEAINNGASEAYNHLAALMGRNDKITIRGGQEEITKILAYCRGLEQDDSTYSMWNNLGVEMIYQKMYPPALVHIEGHGDLDMTAIFICSIERDPSFGKHWNGLGISLKDDQIVTVLQRAYTKQQCYLKALSILPDYCFAWNWLGMTLPTAFDTVVVNGTACNKRECFERAINIDWHYAYPWWNLALVLNAGDVVKLFKKTMTFAEVVERAHELYPTDKDILALMARM